MKKIFSLFVVAAAAVFISGCSSPASNPANNNQVKQNVPPASQTPAEQPPVSQSPTEQPPASQTPNQSPSVTAPDMQITPKVVKQPENSSVSVTIQNYAFNPATINIKKGGKVTWTNQDSAPHQIKSATFNSSTLNQGESFSFTFDTAGTFDYSCAIHPSMTGKVVVQ
jgi:plastocyanin